MTPLSVQVSSLMTLLSAEMQSGPKPASWTHWLALDMALAVQLHEDFLIAHTGAVSL